jgi:hypothetical protein
MLRNQLRRQIKIEIGGSHAVSFEFRISTFKLSYHKISFRSF